MALSGASWSSALYTKLTSPPINWNGTVKGSQLQNFCDAIAKGSVLYLIGKTFATIDIGMTPGSGIGVGTGITGCSATNIANNIVNKAKTFFSGGDQLLPLCSAIGGVAVSQFATISLSSVASPVFLGSGTVMVGSFNILAIGWGAAIQGSGASVFKGAQWPNLATAIGYGLATEFLASGTGALTITGAAPPTPIPGGGSGTGFIS